MPRFFKAKRRRPILCQKSRRALLIVTGLTIVALVVWQIIHKDKDIVPESKGQDFLKHKSVQRLIRFQRLNRRKSPI